MEKSIEVMRLSYGKWIGIRIDLNMSPTKR
jgi:hypothetical protein